MRESWAKAVRRVTRIPSPLNENALLIRSPLVESVTVFPMMETVETTLPVAIEPTGAKGKEGRERDGQRIFGSMDERAEELSSYSKYHDLRCTCFR